MHGGVEASVPWLRCARSRSRSQHHGPGQSGASAKKAQASSRHATTSTSTTSRRGARAPRADGRSCAPGIGAGRTSSARWSAGAGAAVAAAAACGAAAAHAHTSAEASQARAAGGFAGAEDRAQSLSGGEARGTRSRVFAGATRAQRRSARTEVCRGCQEGGAAWGAGTERVNIGCQDRERRHWQERGG
jgi:hypothetical protein